MQIKIFTIPILGNDEMLQEVNNFLATNRVVEVEQACVGERYWTFCIRYVLNDSEKNNNQWKGTVQKKIDYKTILTEDEFARFSVLRAIRKKLAEEDGIPAFAVFTDAELAGFSKLEEMSETALTKVEGVGKQRAKNYEVGIWTENDYRRHLCPMIAFVMKAQCLEFRKSAMKKTVCKRNFFDRGL